MWVRMVVRQREWVWVRVWGQQRVRVQMGLQLRVRVWSLPLPLVPWVRVTRWMCQRRCFLASTPCTSRAGR